MFGDVMGDDFAGAFQPHPKRCYRYVCIDDAGRPGWCEAEIKWAGRYRGANTWWDVVACDRHAAAITNRRRITPREPPPDGTSTAQPLAPDPAGQGDWPGRGRS
jgi:hypothetical protein